MNDDYSSSFEELLDKDGSFLIHHSNIQTLAIEMYKVLHNSSQTLFSNILKIRNNVAPSLRKCRQFIQPRVRTVLNGQNSIRYLGPAIWNLVPMEMKNAESLVDFKKTIKKWKCLNCPCRLCKDYIQNVGDSLLYLSKTLKKLKNY